ncbi:MAG: aminotransferase class III-fold pyridoxal phosphate-dependent enzyme [Phenylobacterium sp.]|uniref:aspartate aminotransferase family protein n=1 Tax=Phenylobacterium sp. TaxID=1871053 RepID=UPI0025E9C023|nr:aminotransferase class III-fold pyridoxal phosphate-dependent enzyme [Phenylobacterium sp.]MBI1199262.1 aminotransferase class III-fold pyridoxal phosphate-dependent enzyme [Phenylobacterium sp.]
MTMINAFAGGQAGLSADDRTLLARREKVLGPAYRLFYETPLHIVRGEGVWLWDRDGRRYLDAYNNVASVGHCRREVVEAISAQSALLNTHTRYLHEAPVAYAEALLQSFPRELGCLMFTCTGSEANDLALRIAQAATGGVGLIVTATAYHGVTAAIAAASPSLGPDNPLGPNVWAVPAPAGASAQGEIGPAFAAGVEAALADMKRRGVRPAALLVDTIFSSDGVLAEPAGFLAAAIAQVRAAGGLFIADEVQAGFGRTGESIWGFARHGVAPDLVTMGKPMGNGYPVAGVVARPEHLEAFGKKVRYFNTFGGSPVAVAAAQAVWDVIRRERLASNSETMGRLLRDRIRALAERRPQLGEVRGAGLFVGVDVVSSDGAPAAGAAVALVNRLRDSGVLISATGPAGNVLKIRPPLVFASEHVNLLMEALESALDGV